jgi:hypothetical protein
MWQLANCRTATVCRIVIGHLTDAGALGSLVSRRSTRDPADPVDAMRTVRPMLEASTEQTRELLQRLLRTSRLRVRQVEDGGYRLQGTGHLLVGAGAGDRTRTCTQAISTL